MAEISYNATKTANVIVGLNNSKEQLSCTTQALQSAANVILSARGIENISGIDFSPIFEMPSKCQEEISKQANQISESAAKVEEYNSSLSGASPIVRAMATKFMFNSLFAEGILTAGEQIVDGVASAAGWVVGFWDKDQQKNIAKWVRNDYVGNFFDEQYSEGGSLYDINRLSYISSNGLGATFIKTAGIATGYALTVAAGGAALGAVSGAVSGTGALAGAASGASALSGSIFAQGATAGLGGLGSGTQSGLLEQREDDLNFDQALQKGVGRGALQAGVVVATPYLISAAGNLLGKGLGSSSAATGAANVADDATSATSTALSTVDDFADDTLESMTNKLYNKEITAEEFNTWANQNKAAVYTEANNLMKEGKWDSIYQKGHEAFVDTLPEAEVVDDVVSNTSSSSVSALEGTTSNEVSGLPAINKSSGLPSTDVSTNVSGLSVANKGSSLSSATGVSGVVGEVSEGVTSKFTSGISSSLGEDVGVGVTPEFNSAVSSPSAEPQLQPQVDTVVTDNRPFAEATVGSDLNGEFSFASDNNALSTVEANTLNTVDDSAGAITELNSAAPAEVSSPSVPISSSNTVMATPEVAPTAVTSAPSATPTVALPSEAPSPVSTSPDIQPATLTNPQVSVVDNTASDIGVVPPSTPGIAQSPPVPPENPTTPDSPFGDPAFSFASPPGDSTPPGPNLNPGVGDNPPEPPGPGLNPGVGDTPESSLPSDSFPSDNSGVVPNEGMPTDGLTPTASPISDSSDISSSLPDSITNSEPEIVSDSPNLDSNVIPDSSYESEPETISDNSFASDGVPESSVNDTLLTSSTAVNEYEDIPNTNVGTDSSVMSDYLTPGIIGVVGGATSAIVGSNMKKEKKDKKERIEEK